MHGLSETMNRVLTMAPQYHQQRGYRPRVLLPVVGRRGTRQAWNKAQRKGALNFVHTRPEGMLIVSRICLAPMVSLPHSMEQVSSARWEELQMRGCLQGMPFMTRMEDAASANRLRECIRQQQSLMHSAGRDWAVLAPTYVTEEHNNIAFAMLARSMCGTTQLLQHSAYPYKLWKLIRSPAAAAEIHHDPVCIKDTFTRDFCTEYNSVAKLRSEDCRLELLCFGSLLRLDISRIECRHAYVRRLVKSRNQAPGPALEDASAASVLMRQRVLEKGSWQSGGRPGASAKEKAMVAKRIFRR
jgi:hypothetical protein